MFQDPGQYLSAKDQTVAASNQVGYELDTMRMTVGMLQSKGRMFDMIGGACILTSIAALIAAWTH